MTDHGKSSDAVSGFLKLAANGDELAWDWLKLFHLYCHETDDVIDNETWDAESLCRVFILACKCYSHDFYRFNVHRLQLPCLLATSTYADSVKWEKSDQPLWKRIWSDVTRHSGNGPILAVSMITGGWAHLRSVEAPLLASCYCYHRERYSTPWEKEAI